MQNFSDSTIQQSLESVGIHAMLLINTFVWITIKDIQDIYIYIFNLGMNIPI